MVDEREFNQFIQAPARIRYRYFIQSVIHFQEIWIVIDQHQKILMAEDDDGNILIPFWPFKEYALYCLEEGMEHCQVVPVYLKEFMRTLLPRFFHREC